MSEFNFKSQICTTRKQSERLLALGLKKETADCMIITKSNYVKHQPRVVFDYDDVLANTSGFEVIPAWSLGRLLELIKHSDICNYNDFGCIKLYIDLDDFETCITMISYMIKEGYFNKEYLV